MKKESNSDEKNILKSETNEDMIDWWVGTVILTFFPILIIPGLFEPPVRTLRATIPENESHIFR